LVSERKQSVPFYKLFFFDDPWQGGCLGGIRKLIHHGYYRHDRQDHSHIQIAYEMGNRNQQDQSCLKHLYVCQQLLCTETIDQWTNQELKNRRQHGEETGQPRIKGTSSQFVHKPHGGNIVDAVPHIR